MDNKKNEGAIHQKHHPLISNLISKIKAIYEINLPARSSLSFTVINFISKGAALLLTPIFTRILTPGEYGEYSLFTSYLSLVLALGSLELSCGVIIRAFQKYKERTYITILLSSFLTSLLILLISFMLFAFKLISGGGMNFPLSYLFLFINAVSTNIINIYLAKCRFSYRWLPSLITVLLVNIAAPIISILLIKFSAYNNINQISAKVGTITFILLCCAVFIIILSIRLAKKEKKEQNLKSNEIILFGRETLQLIFRLSLPMLPYYFLVSIISQADKILISKFIGSSELGKYSVAYSAGIAAAALTSGLCSAICPWIMRKVRAGDFNKIKSVLNAVISICTWAIICFLCLAPDIFAFLAPKEYNDALPIIFISAAIPIPLALAQCMSGIAIAKERVKGLILCGAFPAIFSLFAGILFIPKGNIVIPALITASSYLLLSLLSLLNTKRILGKTIVNANNTLQNLLLFVIFSSFIFAFREYTAIRFSVFIISGAFILISAKSSVKLIKENPDT